MIDLNHSDCAEFLEKLSDNSIEALITDPPAGIGFMGKEWDHHKGGRDEWVTWLTGIMKKCYRVMKPGAHGFVWAIPRTSHWTATALENAGFEIRDVVTHLFGSGFPKSLDISKAIDKAAGAEREVVGEKMGGTKLLEERPWNTGESFQKYIPETAPATESAKQWQGWGTALKPASEHWILIRKPISEKTVAANVLKWGCGGINIDAGRIGTSDKLSIHKGAVGFKDAIGSVTKESFQSRGQSQGRFPANLVLDEVAAEMLDAQSGVLKTGNGPTKRAGLGYQGGEGNESESPRPKNEGGASRFFYCAKTSKSERNAGLDGMEAKPSQEYGLKNSVDKRPGRAEGNRTNEARQNHHPTVKPQKLMSYLIKLITPPGGVVLDPFMGSGSTGCAAKREGFEFIGIEKEKEYFEIAAKRIEATPLK